MNSWIADSPRRGVEAMPRNQSGADKSGPWIGSYADAKAWLSLVKPAPRK